MNAECGAFSRAAATESVMMMMLDDDGDGNDDPLDHDCESKMVVLLMMVTK